MDNKKIDRILEHRIFGPIISATILVGAPLLFYGGIPALARMTSPVQRPSVQRPVIQRRDGPSYQPQHRFTFDDAFGDITRNGDHYQVYINDNCGRRIYFGFEGKNLDPAQKNQLETLTGGN